MNVHATGIAGVFVVDTDSRQDDRGAFARLFCANDLREVLGDRHIVQANMSRTSKVGAVRGMHFQYPPHAEMKAIRCQQGRVWDVIVDLRAGSPTFLQWHAEELSRENARMIVAPEGCAHGFQVLEPDSEMLYLHTAFYHPAAEGGLRHDDPALAISWPMAATELSERDRSHPLLKTDFAGIHS
jgi:dTDP-4-dehydrorhamnose 3,5-epimerase